MSLSALILCPQHCVWGALAPLGCCACSLLGPHCLQCSLRVPPPDWLWGAVESAVGLTSAAASCSLTLSVRLAYMRILWICLKVFTKIRKDQKEGREGLLQAY